MLYVLDLVTLLIVVAKCVFVLNDMSWRDNHLLRLAYILAVGGASHQFVSQLYFGWPVTLAEFAFHLGLAIYALITYPILEGCDGLFRNNLLRGVKVGGWFHLHQRQKRSRR